MKLASIIVFLLCFIHIKHYNHFVAEGSPALRAYTVTNILENKKEHLKREAVEDSTYGLHILSNKKKRSIENDFFDTIKDKYNSNNLSNLPASGGFDTFTGLLEGNSQSANGATENKEKRSAENNFIDTIKDKFNANNLSNLPASGGFDTFTGLLEGNTQSANGATENKEKRSAENIFIDSIKDKFNTNNLSNLPASNGFDTFTGLLEGNTQSANGATENKEKRSAENNFIDSIKDKFNTNNLSNLPASNGFDTFTGLLEGNTQSANGATENKEKRSAENNFIDTIKDKFNSNNLSNLPASGGFDKFTGLLEGNTQSANGATENKEKRSAENNFIDSIKDKFNTNNLSNLPASGGIDKFTGLLEGNTQSANGATENKEKRSAENNFIDTIKDKFNSNNLSNLPASGGFDTFTGLLEGNTQSANGATENKEKRSAENNFIDTIKDKFNSNNLSNLPVSGGFDKFTGLLEGNTQSANGATENKEKRSAENNFIDSIKDKFNSNNLSNLPASGGFDTFTGLLEGNTQSANGATENKEKRSAENNFIDSIKDKFNSNNLSNLPASGGFDTFTGLLEGNSQSANGVTENKEKRSAENNFIDSIKDKFNTNNLSNLPASGGFDTFTGLLEGNSQSANGAAENKEKRSAENNFIDTIKDKFNTNNLSNLPASGGFDTFTGLLEGNSQSANGATENKEKRSAENNFIDTIKDKFNSNNLSNLPASGGFDTFTGLLEGNTQSANGATENREKRSAENNFIDTIKNKFNTNNLSNLPASGGFDTFTGLLEGNTQSANGATENKEKRSAENNFIDTIKDKFNTNNLSNLPVSGGFDTFTGLLEGNTQSANGATENKEKRSAENNFIDSIKDKFNTNNLSNLPASGGFDTFTGLLEGNSQSANGAAENKEKRLAENNFIDSIKDKFNTNNLSNLPASGGFDTFTGLLEGNSQSANGATENKEKRSAENNFIDTIKDKFNTNNLSNLPASGGFDTFTGLLEGNSQSANGAAENKEKRSAENNFIDTIKDKFNSNNLSNLPASGGFDTFTGLLEGNTQSANGATENKEKRSAENNFIDTIKDKFNTNNLSNLPASGGFDTFTGLLEGNTQSANGATENKEKRSAENNFIDTIKDKFNTNNLSNLPASGGFDTFTGLLEGNKQSANGATENKEKRSAENNFIDTIKDKFNTNNLSNLPASGGFDTFTGLLEGNTQSANGATENKEKRSAENNFIDSIKDKFNSNNLSNLPASGGFDTLTGLLEGNSQSANGATENKEKGSAENNFIDSIKDKFNSNNLSNLSASGGFDTFTGLLEGNTQSANGATENKEKRSAENNFIDTIKDKFNTNNLSNLPASGGFDKVTGLLEGNTQSANGATENKEKRSAENNFIDSIKDKFNTNNLSNLPASNGFDTFTGLLEGNTQSANGAAENKEKRSAENNFIDSIKDKFNTNNLSNLPASGGFDTFTGLLEGNTQSANGATENKEKRSAENNFIDSIKDKFNTNNLSNLPASGGFDTFTGLLEGNTQSANGAAENKEKRSAENNFIDSIKDKFNTNNLSNLPASGGFDSFTGLLEGNTQSFNEATENKEKR